MASSKKHWPSMFKSKACCNNNQNNPQWRYHQHDMNNPSLMSSCYPRTGSHTSVLGSAERSPEPKPRWNPRPEQIRILESIFNSGTVNPPRDEIRKIRAQLQEYGQVGDANVFYWFQNRKSRSKHKLRHPHNSKQQPHHHNSTTITSAATATAITAPSSFSSDKYSPAATDMTFPFGSANIIGMSNSPTSSVNQPYFQTPNEYLPEPFFFPVQQTSEAATASAFSTQGFCFPELANGVHVPADQTVGDCSNLLLMSELMMNPSLQKKVEVENQNLQQPMSYTEPTAPTASIHSVPPPTVTVPSSISQILGAGFGDSAAAFEPEKSTVFINDVAIEVASGPFNVREAFGDDAVLVNSSGLPVLTNQWGLTLHPLQHGEFYYLIRTSIPITP